MIEDEDIFSIMSKCFAPIDEHEWQALTKGTTWSGFLDGARRAMQDEGLFGCAHGTIQRVGRRCPLQDFLSAGEVKALFAPPTFAEKERFAARHFTGGLPESAVPVESLYVRWSHDEAARTPFSRTTGLYQADSALYMGDLIGRLGLELPKRFSACPDHLALELDLVAVLLRSGMRDEARQYLSERFEWLTAYRMRLLSLTDDTSFYVGLVDVLLGIRAQQGAVSPIPNRMQCIEGKQLCQKTQ